MQKQREKTPKLQAGDPPRLTQAEYDLYKFQRTQDSDLPLLGTKWNNAPLINNNLDLLSKTENKDTYGDPFYHPQQRYFDAVPGDDFENISKKLGISDAVFLANPFSYLKKGYADKILSEDEVLNIVDSLNRYHREFASGDRTGKLSAFLNEKSSQDILQNNRGSVFYYSPQTKYSEKNHIDRQRRSNLDKIVDNQESKQSIINNYMNIGMPEEEATRLLNNFQSGKRAITPEDVLNNFLPRGTKLDPIKMVNAYIKYGK